MSAVNANPSDREQESLRRAQRAHEPSMEEILASIRSIIAEERAPADDEPKAPPAKGQLPGPQIVYSKTETSAARAPAASDRRPETATELPAPMWSKNPVAFPEQTTPIDEDARLVSPETEKTVASAFDDLSVRLAARSVEVAEGVAREMLRPMLKAWLDENLPQIVERLVRSEIERMSRAAL